MKISLVITLFNEWEILQTMLARNLAELQEEVVEVIVASNAEEGSGESFFHPRHSTGGLIPSSLLYCGPNRGKEQGALDAINAGCLLAARSHAEADWILHMHYDLEIQKREALLETLYEAERRGSGIIARHTDSRLAEPKDEGGLGLSHFADPAFLMMDIFAATPAYIRANFPIPEMTDSPIPEVAFGNVCLDGEGDHWQIHPEAVARGEIQAFGAYHHIDHHGYRGEELILDRAQ